MRPAAARTLKDYGHSVPQPTPLGPRRRPRARESAGRDGTARGDRACRPPRDAAACHRGRVPFGVLDAAWPEDRRSAARAARQAGFVVREVPEGHSVCGSAGTYNILQPEIADAAARPQGRQRRIAPAATSSRPATSAASRSSRRDGLPWCTRSSCSTGRPAGRRRPRGSLAASASVAERPPKRCTRQGALANAQARCRRASVTARTRSAQGLK